MNTHYMYVARLNYVYFTNKYNIEPNKGISSINLCAQIHRYKIILDLAAKFLTSLIFSFIIFHS